VGVTQLSTVSQLLAFDMPYLTFHRAQIYSQRRVTFEGNAKLRACQLL